jgi:hypothetical protein
MRYTGGSEYELSTGKRISAYGGRLSIAPRGSEDEGDMDSTFGGWDEYSTGRNEMTEAERNEVAEFMCEQWRAWARGE